MKILFLACISSSMLRRHRGEGVGCRLARGQRNLTGPQAGAADREWIHRRKTPGGLEVEGAGVP